LAAAALVVDVAAFGANLLSTMAAAKAGPLGPLRASQR